MGAVTLGLVALVGCGSSGSGGSGGGVTQPSGGAKDVYVITTGDNGLNGSVLEFAAGSQGSIAPKTTLTLPQSFEPFSVATDSSGQIYVGGFATPTLEILVYPAGSTGSITPTRTIITGESTDAQLIIPDSMTIDASGLLYVVGRGGNVAVYSATANETAPPVQLITSGVLTGPVGIAVDGTGNMYVSNEVPTEDSSTGTIYVFAPGATGDATPTRTITSANVFFGIAVDTSGNIYTTENAYTVDGSGDIEATTAQIDEFGPSASGAATPTKTIAISSGGQPITIAAGLRIDSAGDLFTAAQTATNATGNATLLTQVVEFGPAATGSATPVASFSSTSWVYPSEEIAIH